jgi:hypothetical protein
VSSIILSIVVIKFLLFVPVDCRFAASENYGYRKKTVLNCIDRVTATCRRSKCHLLLEEDVALSVERIPTAVFSNF